MDYCIADDRILQWSHGTAQIPRLHTNFIRGRVCYLRQSLERSMSRSLQNLAASFHAAFTSGEAGFHSGILPLLVNRPIPEITMNALSSLEFSASLKFLELA